MTQRDRRRRPAFLVIGGMKCGSTTLYDDLVRVGAISGPEKEINFFNSEDSNDPELLERYLSQFDSSGRHADVSTSYAMKPRYCGTAARSHSALGAVPIIYMVRNPIERAISHHHHLQARGTTSVDFVTALDEFPEICDFGRYEMQVKDWDECFGQENVLMMPLDRYNDGGFEQVLQHVGVSVEPGTASGHSNATESARVFTGTSRKIYESRVAKLVYREGVRKLLPTEARSALRNKLLPAPPKREQAPPVRVLRALSRSYEDTVDFVSQRTGTRWDLEATCVKLGAV